VTPKDTKDNEPEATTGHEWDGIRELDNPLPRWWLIIFYASIIFAIGYWVMMPAWPGISGYTQGLRGHSDRVNLERSLAGLKTVRGAQAAKLSTASLEEIESDPQLQSLAMAIGGSVFGDNCAACHGQGGTGSRGYANLRDDVWLWGGDLAAIHHTITVGIRSGAEDRTSKMPAFGRDELLTSEEIGDVTELVVSLSGRPANAAAILRARPIFERDCVACHKADGTGNQAKGAPDLTDREWLYGSRREDIREQLTLARAGVMPAWGKRLPPEIVKALAVYVHASAGGQ
jgi:cytochrome c oxidase cbb3-type subunit 3